MKLKIVILLLGVLIGWQLPLNAIDLPVKLDDTKKTSMLDGQWYKWDNPMLMYCCDCGLAHVVEYKYRLFGLKIYSRWTQIPERTKYARATWGAKYSMKKKEIITVQDPNN